MEAIWRKRLRIGLGVPAMAIGTLLLTGPAVTMKADYDREAISSELCGQAPAAASNPPVCQAADQEQWQVVDDFLSGASGTVLLLGGAALVGGEARRERREQREQREYDELARRFGYYPATADAEITRFLKQNS